VLKDCKVFLQDSLSSWIADMIYCTVRPDAYASASLKSSKINMARVETRSSVGLGLSGTFIETMASPREYFKVILRLACFVV